MSEELIVHKNAGESLALVNQLKSDGLVQHVDFIWRFVPGRYDYDTMETGEPHSVVTFFDPKHAVIYALKWL